MGRAALGWTLLLGLFGFGTVRAGDVPKEDERDYVTFRLLVGRESFGDIRTICVGDSVFVNLPDVKSALGYPCDSTVALPSASWVIRDEGSLFLLSTHYQEVCGFPLTVFFQGFRLRVSESLEFPKLKQRRQERLREVAFGRREDLLLQHVDTLPLRMGQLSSVGYSLSVNSDRQGLGGYSGVLSAGGEFLKGSLNLNYNRTALRGYQANQLTFKLDFAPETKLLRQVSLFRNFNTFTMDLGGFATGVYLSNDNATFFDQRTYAYRGQTRPNANVEIYNNGVLVAYCSADSLGRYEASIPVTSGSNSVTTLTLNDYGESLSEQRTLYMPLYLQPVGKLKYAVTSGYTDGGRLFGGAYAAYGLTAKLTTTLLMEAMLCRGRWTEVVGVGAKYAPAEWLQLSTDYLPGVRVNAGWVGSIGHRLGYSLTWEQYRAGQTKVAYAPKQSFQGSASTPLPLGKTLRNTLTLTVRQTKYAFYQQCSSSLRMQVSRGSLTASAYVTGSSQHGFMPERYQIGTSVGSRLGARMYSHFSYGHQLGRFNHQLSERLQYRLDKLLSATAEVQYQTEGRQLSFQFGFSYRLPCITLGSNVRTTGADWAMSNSVSGGINFYGRGLPHFTDQATSGAMLRVVLFVDRNSNGVYDRGETIVENPKVKLRTIAEQKQDKSGTYFGNIPPNRAFRLLIPRQVLKDITWQITPVDTAFCLSPFQSHTVYFPVKVLSSVSGEVYRLVDGKRVYLRNVLLSITPVNGSRPAFRIRTDDWGFYDYGGLTAGIYRISLLNPNLQAKGEPWRELKVAEGDEGEQLEGIDFEVE